MYVKLKKYIFVLIILSRKMYRIKIFQINTMYNRSSVKNEKGASKIDFLCQFNTMLSSINERFISVNLIYTQEGKPAIKLNLQKRQSKTSNNTKVSKC